MPDSNIFSKLISSGSFQFKRPPWIYCDSCGATFNTQVYIIFITTRVFFSIWIYTIWDRLIFEKDHFQIWAYTQIYISCLRWLLSITEGNLENENESRMELDIHFLFPESQLVLSNDKSDRILHLGIFTSIRTDVVTAHRIFTNACGVMSSGLHMGNVSQVRRYCTGNNMFKLYW